MALKFEKLKNYSAVVSNLEEFLLKEVFRYYADFNITDQVNIIDSVSEYIKNVTSQMKQRNLKHLNEHLWIRVDSLILILNVIRIVEK